jgi:hypothetical protein
MEYDRATTNFEWLQTDVADRVAAAGGQFRREQGRQPTAAGRGSAIRVAIEDDHVLQRDGPARLLAEARGRRPPQGYRLPPPRPPSRA